MSVKEIAKSSLSKLSTRSVGKKSVQALDKVCTATCPAHPQFLAVPVVQARPACSYVREVVIA